MIRGRHAIEAALDLTRMPALARYGGNPPLPPNIIDIIRIASGSSTACADAAQATGERPEVLIEAARFYIQQCLFKPDADCFRVLGLQRGASRSTARMHMRLLLEWLHPDRNSAPEAIYAQRVLNAWRDVSSRIETDVPDDSHSLRPGRDRVSIRIPWIKRPSRNRRRFRLKWMLPGLLLLGTICYGVYAVMLPSDWIAALWPS